jgi:hypothetical protein
MCWSLGVSLPLLGLDLLFTIEGQEGRWRSLMQNISPVQVGCGRCWSLRLLHFAAALATGPKLRLIIAQQNRLRREHPATADVSIDTTAGCSSMVADYSNAHSINVYLD